MTESMTTSLPIKQHPRFESFEDYLAYEDGGDGNYELFNGELVEVPPESGWNVAIATKLLLNFAQVVGYLRVRGQGLELEVQGEPRNRFPDLTILREEHIPQLMTRNTLRWEMAPPELVVEVVSPGEVQRNRDYIAKRNQYGDRGIPAYWIMAPQKQQVVIFTLVEGLYQEVVYRSSDRLPFQDQRLDLTATETLSITD